MSTSFGTDPFRFLGLAPGREDAAQTIEAMLGTIRRHLDMDVAFVGRFRDGRRVLEFVDVGGGASSVERGRSDPVEKTYCARVADGRLPSLVPDTAAEAVVADLPMTAELSIGSYVSAPLVRDNGDVLGTLCCFSHEPDPTLRERDARLLRMFADVVSAQLEQIVDEEQAHRARHDLISEVIERGGPRMAMQPIVDLATRQVRGLEALARFPEHADWTPETWFAEAATVGLGAELEASAIRSALQALPLLPDGVVMSVNVSAGSLCRDDILEMLAGSNAPRLVVELTEHTRIDDYDALADALADIRAAGARLAVDDAGSGWASLEHILQLQPEVLKLDRALVSGVHDHPGRRAMIEAMRGFAERMGATLIAEGIEESEELRTLSELGVQYGQGYLLGRPSLECDKGVDGLWRPAVARVP
jgi:EAL domain-containing protein (putative c-di-GMP-specific phosphodiesterase class I)